MNRKKSPKTIKEMRPGNISPQLARLDNTLPLYLISAGSQPVTRVDFIFSAGSWHQSKPLMASSTSAMLSEGTENLTGEEIARKADYYGAYINTSSDRDNAFVTIYSLSRYLDEVMPLAADIIKNPSFPERELETMLERRKQRFLIEKTRVSSLAREQFAASVFGKEHPYGRTLSPEDFDNVCPSGLAGFHRDHYRADNCKILVSGSYDQDKVLSTLDHLFGSGDWVSGGTPGTANQSENPHGLKKVLIYRDDAVQSALRIGRRMFPKNSIDYPGMMVVNSILGGHFGSRLMQNIREKRGYTYGIGSVLAGLKYDGFMAIVSEVGAEHREAAVTEIYRELEKLCNKPVSEKELDLTKRHMLGEILRSFDGPFAWLESIRNVAEAGMDHSFYDNLIDTVTEITPQQVHDLAKKYLMPAEMVEVVAGK